MLLADFRFSGIFAKKISRAKHAQPYNAPWKKPLLPRIKYNTKCVKLQELNYIYSISYFFDKCNSKAAKPAGGS